MLYVPRGVVVDTGTLVVGVLVFSVMWLELLVMLDIRVPL